MLYFIVNPAAGRGRALSVRRALEAHLQGLCLPARWLDTTEPGHATALAAQAVRQGASAIYAVGGDGTAHETAQGLLATGVPMGIIPGGTGNDLAAFLGIPRDPVAAFDCQLRDAARPCDAWTVNGKLLLNVAGTGFDSETLLHTGRFKALGGGKPSYILGVLTTILTHRDLWLTVTIEGKTRTLPLLMLTIANGRCIGGGIMVAPEAKLDDGLLDIILYHPVPRLQMPFKLGKFMKGTQMGESFVEHLRAREITFRSDREIMQVQIDGELHAWQSVTVCPAQGALWLLAHAQGVTRIPLADLLTSAPAIATMNRTD